jgi:hypothetical protein
VTEEPEDRGWRGELRALWIPLVVVGVAALLFFLLYREVMRGLSVT